MRDVASAKATNLVVGIFRSPQKLGLKRLIVEKNMDKNWVNLLQPPDYAGKNKYGQFWAFPKNTKKKRLRSHPGNFEPLRGKPYLWKKRRQASSCLS